MMRFRALVLLLTLSWLLACSITPDRILRAQKPWIIDTHTHFKGAAQIAYEKTIRNYDPKNTLGYVVTPQDYRPIADRLMIRGTVVVEAVDQDKPEFSDWLLRQASSDLICGYVGRADLRSESFVTHHDRFMKTGLLKGYRFRMGELHGYLDDPTAQKHLALLQRQGLVAL
ncbi:MAG: hypothetical protein AAFN70_14460 [Planctomycetota bacterium]